MFLIAVELLFVAKMQHLTAFFPNFDAFHSKTIFWIFHIKAFFSFSTTLFYTKSFGEVFYGFVLCIGILMSWKIWKLLLYEKQHFRESWGIFQYFVLLHWSIFSSTFSRENIIELLCFLLNRSDTFCSHPLLVFFEKVLDQLITSSLQKTGFSERFLNAIKNVQLCNLEVLFYKSKTIELQQSKCR